MFNILSAECAKKFTLVCTSLMRSFCCDAREDSPGHRECDSSIQQISRYIHDLDQASLSAASQGGLRGNFPGSIQSYQEQVLNSARQLLDLIDPLRTAAKGEADNLPHLVLFIVYY